jgi:predicted phage terminase large subunit-like protein
MQKKHRNQENNLNKNYTINQPMSEDIVKKMTKDLSVRTAITRQSHFYFFHCYFRHYVTYPTAPFQKEIFHLTERDDIKNLFICAFRGSGKSTVITMSYPIWAILGEQQKKFVLILCQTKAQAKQHMLNLKRELENNTLLRNDMGPFEEENSEEWASSSLVFPQLNARIMAASQEQSIRGLRHAQYRPDLIIADDVEDVASAKNHEGRAKTYNWLKSDVIPAGDKNTRLVIIGNLLFEDSLLPHLKKDLLEGKIEGIFREYPLLDEKGNILWPGKYPTMEEVKKEERRVGNDVAWKREYLLRIIPDEDQVVDPAWIQYYDEIPGKKSQHGTFIGIDLAISQADTADYTAMVTAVLAGREKNFCAYILPNPVNRKMGFPETVTQIKALYDSLDKDFYRVRIVVEDVGYQRAVIEQLDNDGYKAEGIKVVADKRSRLMTVSSLIQSGKIKFPRKGAERLIEQILGLGVERYDDLADAFSIVAHQAIKADKPGPSIFFIEGPSYSERGWHTIFSEDRGMYDF